MILELLNSSSSVEEFKDKLLKVVERKEESLAMFSASLYAGLLLRGIEKALDYNFIKSIKFVVYPDNSGADIVCGEDVDSLSKRFGWQWKELDIVRAKKN